jgi:acetyltransferase-like isoleucine patch superfamily enzyme
MLNKLGFFYRLPVSRKIQYLDFLYRKVLVKVFYRLRLKSCGTGNIVQPPLFWTPECISLGSNVLIWKGCRIEGIERSGEVNFQPEIKLGDNVSLQQNCHITAAGQLSIGKNTTISFNVMINDTDHQYEQYGVNVLMQPLKYEKTFVGENCFIGAGAKIQAGTHLGKHCIVGANAVVRGQFPDYCVIVGVPGRIVKRLDSASGLWKKTNKLGEFIDE